MNNESGLMVLAGVAVYMIAMLVIGLRAAKRTHSTDDFLVAGRNMPLWLCAATVMATWIGGGTMLGAAGEAYEGGVLAVIADPLGAALGLVLVGLLIVRTVRRLRLVTVIDFVELRFGKTVAVLSAIGVAGSGIGWAGALMVAFGTVTHSLTGLPMEWGIIIGGTIMLVYTTAGGMWAVAATDFVQLAIIVFGLVALLVVVVIQTGGPAMAWSMMPAEKLRLLPLENDPATWLNYIRAWFIIGIANLSSQSLIQRGLSARTEAIAEKSFYIGGVGYLVVGMIPVLLAILGGEIMPGLTDGSEILPALAMEYLHPVLMAVFVGALLSAIMSSADSAMLGASGVIATNVIPKLFPQAPASRQLRWARITIPVIGVVAGGIALKVQAVYELILMANVVQLAAITGPFLIGLWWQRATIRGGQLGLASGILTLLLIEWLLPHYPGDLIALFISMATTIVVSLLTQRSHPPQPLLDRDGNAVDTAGLRGWN